MYSHDTFGLGHLRRSRTIAHALVGHFPDLEVSIISGSPVVDAFWFHDRVSYVQIPAAQKLSNGEYSSGNSAHSLEETLTARETIIREAAERLRPDMVIVDKEPLGLGREMLPTLRWAKAQGATAVLGLRDVLDAPELLQAEWERKQNAAFTEEIYDEIWVYGPGSFYNPLSSIDLHEELLARTRYTGFLARSLPPTDDGTTLHFGNGYILVTAGGGGDGYELMAAALNAVKRNPHGDDRYLFVLGPFMTERQRFEITARASSLRNVEVVDFHVNVETLVANAAAVVGMCGYNTFCEVMSFDKPALFVPRTAPRREQSIRAHRAAEFGWVDVLDIEEAKNPSTFVAAIERLKHNSLPSQAVATPDLDGLSRICALTEILFEQRNEDIMPMRGAATA
jgi:predicted glycosyltransferase